MVVVQKMLDRANCGSGDNQLLEDVYTLRLFELHHQASCLKDAAGWLQKIFGNSPRKNTGGLSEKLLGRSFGKLTVTNSYESIPYDNLNSHTQALERLSIWCTACKS